MRIPMTCHCGIKMRVPGEYAGRRIRCKTCGAASIVPTASPAAVHSLGSASVLIDVTPEPRFRADRRIELLPDDRFGTLMPDGDSSAILAELGRPASVPWSDLPRLAREATDAGITVTVAPRRSSRS